HRLVAQNSRLEETMTVAHNQAKQSCTSTFHDLDNSPHKALTWSWCMYLALFNGGRHIYRALETADTEFWLEDNTDDENNNKHIEALSFWRFDSEDANGNDVQVEFKTAFDAAGEVLGAEEQEEVVCEGVEVFRFCLGLVEEIGRLMQNVEPCHLKSLSSNSNTSSSQEKDVTGKDKSEDSSSSWWQRYAPPWLMG
ncbi:hypothetical protein LTR66_016775, partial [Elasticomyces elasticus]